MGQKKVSTEELKEMLELRAQGRTIRDLSKKYGISYQRVHQLTIGVTPQGICRYCHTKINKGTICSECFRKLQKVRELKAIGNLILRKAGRLP